MAMNGKAMHYLTRRRRAAEAARTERRAASLAARDAAYRAALGLADAEPMPSALGVAAGHSRPEPSHIGVPRRYGQAA